MKLYIFILFILHSLSYSGFDEGKTKPENKSSAISPLLTQSVDYSNKSVETPKTNVGDELVASTSQPKQSNPISETDHPYPVSLHEAVQSLLASHVQIIDFLKEIEKVILPPESISETQNSFYKYKAKSVVDRIKSLELESNCMAKSLVAIIKSIESKFKLDIENMSHSIKADLDSIKEKQKQCNETHNEIQRQLDQMRSKVELKILSIATTSTATQTLSDNDINPTSEKTQKRLWRLNRELQCKMQPDGKGRGEVNPTMDKKRSSETAPDNPKRTKRLKR